MPPYSGKPARAREGCPLCVPFSKRAVRRTFSSRRWARAGGQARERACRTRTPSRFKNQSIRTVLALLAREAGGRMPSSSIRSTKRAALLKPMRKRRWSREMDMRPCSCTKVTASAYRDSSSELPGPEAGAEDALAFSARDVPHSVKSTSYCGAHWRLQ